MHRFVTVACSGLRKLLREADQLSSSDRAGRFCRTGRGLGRRDPVRDPDHRSPLRLPGPRLRVWSKHALQNASKAEKCLFIHATRSWSNIKTALYHPDPRARSTRSEHHVSGPEIQTSFKVASKVSGAPLCIPTTAEPGRAERRRAGFRLPAAAQVRAPARQAAALLPADDISSKNT